MDDQVEDNAEVLEAVNQQKDLINDYLMSKTKVESSPTVIPATSPEKPDLLFKSDFLAAIDDLKKQTDKKGELNFGDFNKPLESENSKESEEDLTPEQEEELKKEYPEIDFNKPLGPGEDEEYTKGFKKRLYENLKVEEKKEEKPNTPKSEETKSESQPVLKKQDNVPNVSGLDDKLKKETINLPDAPAVDTEKNVTQQPVLELSKPKLEEKTPLAKNTSKTFFEIKSNNIVESSIPKKDIQGPSEALPPIINTNTVAEQPLEKEQKITETPTSSIPQDVSSAGAGFNKILESRLGVEPPPAAPKDSVEKAPVITTSKKNTPKIDETPTQNTNTASTTTTRANLPAEDQNSQQPLKTVNYSEASLDELNKNIIGLNNNVNNISNMLANATSILANIASKENNATNINSIAGGSNNQQQQYQMIDGGIDGYRQSFRTPNSTNDVLGRTLTPNIPGVSYV